MVKPIMKDIFFLGQKSEPATKADLQVGRKLLFSLMRERTQRIFTPTMPDFESVWQHLAKSTPTCADWKKIVNKVE